MPVRMHDDEVELDEELVRRLIVAQMPHLARREMSIVEPWGTDHAIWRLGDDLVVRLPRMLGAAGQVAHESTWLPMLAPHLPVAVPEPVALGEPALGYPFRWAVHQWIEGEAAAPGRVAEPVAFALDVAELVGALQSVPTRGAPPAAGRARALSQYDDATRSAIDRAGHLIDAAAALQVWQEALDAPPHHGNPVWVHGDLEGNCLVRDGRLYGVVDWGSSCAGDPAVDVQVIWSPLFDVGTRRVLLDALQVDDATVARSRGAAINQACTALPYYLQTSPQMVACAQHKLSALGVRSRGAAH